MTKMNIKNALAKIGVTDKKQTEFMAAFEGKSLADISEKDVAAELENLGITGENAVSDFLAAVREPEIMDQELDLDELESVAGGDCNLKDQEKDQKKCVKDHWRFYYKDGCASTVEVYTDSTGRYVADGRCSNSDHCKHPKRTHPTSRSHIR